jgi:hypothetical protein
MAAGHCHENHCLLEDTAWNLNLLIPMKQADYNSYPIVPSIQIVNNAQTFNELSKVHMMQMWTNR